MDFKPVNTISVVDEVVKRITDAILRKDLKPGQKIPTENEFCDKLGVGRNSLREAIKMLSALGILEIRRGDGTYIAEKISPSAFDSLVYSVILQQSTPDEILELRKSLDIDVLELVINKATNEDILLLEDIHREFLSHLEKEDYEKIAIWDLQFHYALIDIARNPLLGRIVKGVYALFWPSLENTLRRRKEYIGAYQKHGEIMEIITSRDKARIPSVIEKSLEVWKEYWTD